MTTDTQQTPASAEDQALKARHAAMWALGDYPAVARDIIPALGPALVEACGVRPGHRVLDVAAGSGNAAIPAALAGASVVATDLTPELVEEGRRSSAAHGARLDWQVADAESLPFGDGDFDVVMSCVGVMFAPHHERSADELVRVTRAGGTIGLLSWTPEGFIGQMFAVMKPYAAPPAPGAQPAPLWGREGHVRALLGDRVEDVRADRRHLEVHFDRPEDFRDFFKRTYGPVVATYGRIADDPAAVAALDTGLTELARQHMDADGRMGWEYLLLTATRRG